MPDVLQVQGINSKGFGVISKVVMQDKRLTAQAKAIYSYLCTYTGAGYTAFPSRRKIMADLDIGKDKYYVHFNLLKRYGYVKAQQQRSGKGKFKCNLFTLSSSLPFAGLSCTDKPYPSSSYPDNQDTKKNKNKNKHIFVENNSLSCKLEGQDETMVSKQGIEDLETKLRANVSYDELSLSYPNDICLVDELIAIMVDVLITPGGFVEVEREFKPRELVSYRLESLCFEDIEHVILQFKNLKAPITKKKQYLLTMLYNCKLERESHYTNLARSDL
jgi:hypothetical protein